MLLVLAVERPAPKVAPLPLTLVLPRVTTAGVLARRGVRTPAAAESVDVEGDGEGGRIGEGGGRGIVARCEPDGVFVLEAEGDGGTDI